MKNFFKALKIIIKILLCFLLSVFFIGSIFINLLVAGPCLEIIYIAIFSFVMVPLTWLIAFAKIKYINWFGKIIIYIFLLYSYMEFPHLFPNIKLAWDDNICYDDGYCKEGLTWAGEKITEEYCLKHNQSSDKIKTL